MDAPERMDERPSRRDLIVDVVLAITLGAFVTFVTYVASHEQPSRRAFDIGTVVLIWVAAGALVARRRHPVAVLVVVFGATLVYFTVGYANGPIWLALIVAYVTAVLKGHRLAAGIIAVLGFALFPWLDYLIRDGPAPSVVALAALAAWLLVLLGGAEIVRYRRERAAEAIRIREEEDLRRASEERLRIARELHDALGHHLSLINVQSGVALHLNEDLPEQARSSLSAIKQASKEALIELRSVLEILREQGERAPRFPTSTLARLNDLVSQAAAAGLDVRTEIEGTLAPPAVRRRAGGLPDRAGGAHERHASRGGSQRHRRRLVWRSGSQRPGRQRRQRIVAGGYGGYREGHRGHAGTRECARW